MSKMTKNEARVQFEQAVRNWFSGVVVEAKVTGVVVTSTVAVMAVILGKLPSSGSGYGVALVMSTFGIVVAASDVVGFISNCASTYDVYAAFHAWQNADGVDGPNPNPHDSPGYDDHYKNYFNCQRLAKEYSNTGYIRPSHDPIALDLDGDGVEFIKDGAYFDYDGNKFAERATWLGKDDGWLTRDVNGDGTINDGTELFGDSMKLKSGALAKNGFEALAEFDDNKDGVIDDKDAVYSQLRVWQDVNGNGISDAGELKALSELGIKQLNLDKTDVTGAELANGESVRQQGAFVWNSGVIGQMNGYVVNRDVIDSKETELLPVPDEFIFQLEHRKIPVLQRENW